MRGLLVALLLILASGTAHAVEPDEVLADPVLEQRARDISKNLRCLVCQNQSIDDSNAGLARDLRVLVRERLVAGDDNDAVIRHIVERYGDYVLLRPPVKPSTYLLWFGPVLIVAGAGAALFLFYRRRRATSTPEAPTPLTEEERKELETLLGEDRG
jgi:cytochrome c-type biogenesis protein CcmH